MAYFCFLIFFEAFFLDLIHSPILRPYIVDMFDIVGVILLEDDIVLTVGVAAESSFVAVLARWYRFFHDSPKEKATHPKGRLFIFD